MKLRNVLFVLLSAVVPMSAPAFADEVSAGVYINAAPGEAVPSVDVFYDRLSPYGTWVDDAQLGRVFVPATDGFVPYRVGHWQYTDAGFVWVSSEPFAWATSHYGRWGFSDAFGRWVWTPDLTWGPSWVTWNQAGGDFGWTPMLPAVYVGLGYTVPVAAWQFCPSEHILDVNLVGFYEPPERVAVLQRNVTVINNYTTIGGARVMVGPNARTLASVHVNVQPVKLDMTIAGRFTASDAHAAAVHAQANKATFEANNRARIQANPKLAAVQAKTKPAEVNRPATTTTTRTPDHPATTTPSRTEPSRTEPTRTQPARTETTKPEPTKPEPTRTEPARTEATRPEATKPETKTDTKTDTKTETKTETTRPETTRTQPAKTTTPSRPVTPAREQGAEQQRNPDRN